MDSVGRPGFKPGDRVLVRDHAPRYHHRTPQYIKGRSGHVQALCGTSRNPESLAYGGSGLPEVNLYWVEFDQADLWERYEGPPQDKLLIDVYEHWLEPGW